MHIMKGTKPPSCKYVQVASIFFMESSISLNSIYTRYMHIYALSPDSTTNSSKESDLTPPLTVKKLKYWLCDLASIICNKKVS